MIRTLVVGGGAAGMAAAIAARERGDVVTVLERNAKTLKKLGVTGNGRGNVLNAGEPVYYGDAAFARQVLEAMPYAKLAAFLEDLGVPLRLEAEGRVYPAALQASVVVDALRLRAAQLGVEVICHTRVERLRTEGGGFLAEAKESVEGVAPEGSKSAAVEIIERKYRADRVIITVGGAAAPAHGTDGTAYSLLAGFGHTLAEPSPALCALLTEKKPLSGLAGQRVRASLTLTGPDGALLHEAAGEALFAEDGVSGIAAMQLGRFAMEGCLLHMDLRPAIGMEGANAASLFHWLQGLAARREGLPMAALFTGVMTPPLSRAMMRAAGIVGLERPMEALGEKDFKGLARTLADFTLTVAGVRGFGSAQVTAGGVYAAAFRPDTMESLLQKGLYAAGEVLNVDGDCGGFNLMFAFASGLLAGRGSGDDRGCRP